MPVADKLKHAFIAGSLTFTFLFADAQTLKDNLVKGDRFYQKKDFANALIHYLAALETDANDAVTNFKVGISYLNEENFSPAVAFLEKAYTLKPDVDPDIDYHLGSAYQKDHQYAKALEQFEGFKIRNKKLSTLANQKISECKLGDSLMRIPVHADIGPLTALINTAFSEFAPLITQDGKTLIFTSNRSDNDYQIKSATNFDDVFISQEATGKWSVPQKISSNINSRLNERATSISPDGKTLFLYYEEGNGDIYTSDFENGAWSMPVPLNKFINHPQYRESSACLSSDGKKLYFSSNRPGGKGGYDIYVCDLGSNGQWGRPSNLGSTINTRSDEDSPFLHKDGVTLYFSSDGHPALGSFDIFRSTLQNGKWTAPENLGYPVNTSGFDGYFTLSDDKTTGYLSSSRTGGSGNLDLYRLIFRSTANKTSFSDASTGKSGNRQRDHKIVTRLKGFVIDVQNAEPLQATISLVDNSNKSVVSKIRTGPGGDFELIIPHGGNYGVTTITPGYLFNSMNFNLPSFEKYQEIDTHVLMVKAEVGSKVVLKNIFFDINESVLKPESHSELETIRYLLLENPNWRIQINGHTDNSGQAGINETLSLKRAQSVVQYLVKAGIAPARLQAKGYGSEQPLVSNDDETEGRQINRRTEIEIVE